MRRLPLYFVIVAVLLALAIPAQAQRAPRYADTAGLHVLSSRVLDSRLRDITVSTAALDEPSTIRVMLPRGYNPARRYPVVYLLNGAYDNQTFWTKKARVESIIQRTQAIVVMPDGGYCGFYTDWYNYGLGGNPRWETFHIKQVIPFIDRNFRTTGARGRAIAGLSMGGFGAMSYAGRHPSMFRAAGSFSGGEDMDTATSMVFSLHQEVLDKKLPGGPFGLPYVNEDIRRAHNPPDLAPHMRGVKLDIYSGTGEPGVYDKPGSTYDLNEGTSHEGTMNFIDALRANHVPHTFHEYPGTHKLPYWTRDLRDWLPRIMRVLAH